MIYVIDLAAVSNTICTVLFGGDTNLLISNKRFSELINVVNKGLLAFSDWFQIHKQTLNVKNQTIYGIFWAKK